MQVLNYGKATGANATASAEAKVTGTAIGAYWTPRNDKWGFKLGLSAVSTKNAEAQTNTASTNTSSSGLGVGVGGSYNFTDAYALTFGIDTATFKASGVSGTGGVSLMSVGLRAKF